VIDTVKLPALDMLMVRLRAPDGISAADAIKLLRASNPDTFYELDHYFGVTSGGIDKAAPSMVEMKVPKLQPLWIGMIDTAVWTQATLRGVRVESQNFVGSKSRSGRPPFAHGTAVASILARQGAVRLTSANIFSADARPFSSAEAIARAVNWMVARKVPVINISVAGPRNALVDRVIAAAVARGHVVVAAAGNGGPAAPPAYPAASPGAVAVTAIDRTGLVYLNANRGNYIEISAIGVGIGAEAPDGTMRPHSGTSFAAPFVSAYLARCMKGIAPQSRLACIRQMETRARDLGAPGRDPIYGYGLLVP
jgi:subtilisin family serine protease